ncbi:MAG TPA: alpha/beta fold hydrolase [Burkholderiaceae bacterium]|nr:alpha/beta fold hydrolase [Burkholderiaceae bacterium]
MHAGLSSGIRIEYDVSGPANAPAIVLVMGLGMQLTAWPPSFVEGLVARGFRVLRFDNRDVGLSSRSPGRGRADVRAAMLRATLRLPSNPPYRLEDMAGDTTGLMDALGIARAHVVGVSMGGMIAQVLAALHPSRVASLTSMASSSGALRYAFHWSPAMRAMLTPPPRGADEARLVDHLERIWTLIGSPGMQPPRETLRAQLRANLRRSHDPAGVARQLLAVLASGDRRPLLRRIAAPTLVIHGELDPLVPIGAGRDTAANVPGARFVAIPGLAHDLPEPLVPRLVDEIASHCARADGPR